MHAVACRPPDISGVADVPGLCVPVRIQNVEPFIVSGIQIIFRSPSFVSINIVIDPVHINILGTGRFALIHLFVWDPF